MLACALLASGGFRLTIDRIEDDRVVVEWCDQSTSDLPAALFPADVREGAVVTLTLQPAASAALLPGPNLDEIGPHSAGRPDRTAATPRGLSRTEIEP